MFESVLLPQKGRALEVNTLKSAGQHCHIHPISSNTGTSLTLYCQLRTLPWKSRSKIRIYSC